MKQLIHLLSTNKSTVGFCLTFIFNSSLAASAAETPFLDPHLEPLRPLLEKVWRGPFKNSTPEKPIVDVMRWERALNGKAVRAVHSINDGSYGGETIVMWNEKEKTLKYHDFTTAGFMTTGTMTSTDGKIISHETVTGSANGVTETRSTSEFQADGAFHVKSEYLKNGEWVPGHEGTYKETTSATVVFK